MVQTSVSRLKIGNIAASSRQRIVKRIKFVYMDAPRLPNGLLPLINNASDARNRCYQLLQHGGGVLGRITT
jgi:hypothetical protein